MLDGRFGPLLLRAGVVSRGWLIERARASGATLVSVSAPAGYGKTTMLAEWASAEERRVGWVSLAAADDDPGVLLWLLATAMSDIAPTVAAVVDDMREVGGSGLSRSAPVFAQALRRSPVPFVLFADDVHTVASPACRDVLDVIVAAVPAGSQVVFAGRGEPALVPRLRSAGAVWEITTVDLCVDADGARLIFETAGVPDPSPDTLSAAVERCEGWAAGLFLCARILGDGVTQVGAVTGEDRWFADYLYRECIERLPERLRRFVRRTAILEQLSGPVCDAVLGEAGSEQCLRELEALNVFVVALDRERHRYRYHDLFREFLLAKLDRVEPGLAPELRRRAGGWYEANGLPGAAIEQFLAAGDRARAARLVAATALPVYLVGQVGLVVRWLTALGESAVVACPELMVIAGWVSLLTGETARGRRWAHLLEQVELEAGSEEALLFESARAQVRSAMCADGVARALADARFGFEHEPVWSPWRDQAAYLYGFALMSVGDVARARAAFAESAADANAGERNTDCVIQTEAMLAALAADEGDWVTGARHARTALSLVEAHHLESYATSVSAYAVGARVAFHHHDVRAAERLLTQGMRTRALLTAALPAHAVMVRLQFARTYAAMGHRSAAESLLVEIHDLLRQRPDVGVFAEQAAAFGAELRTMRGGGRPVLTPAEMRVLPYLQTQLTLGEIAGRLLVSRSTVNTQVSSIYRKLGVSSRTAAVERAGETGLLGD